jgi:hypothetical protein
MSARPHTKYRAQTTSFCERHVSKLTPAAAGDVTIDDDTGDEDVGGEDGGDRVAGGDDAVKLFPGT